MQKLKTSLICVLAFAAIMLFIPGCGKKHNAKVQAENKTKTVQTEFPSIIKKLNTGLLKKIISDREGKILIVSLWSTWSGKSMNQLLILNDIYGRYKNDLADFAIITIDAASDIDSKVVPFLKKEDIQFPVYSIDPGEGKHIMKILNPAWTGSIPVTYIYNSKGIQKKILLGLQTQSLIEESINDITN